MSWRNFSFFIFISFVCYTELSSFCPLTSNHPPPYSTLSPINIDTKKAIPFKTSSPLFIQSGILGTLKVVNTGEAVEVYTQPHTSRTSGIYGGVLCNQFYRLHKFRFYINSNLKGSTTHLLDGKGSPLSVSLIGFNSKYSCFEEAEEHSDGIAIVNIQFTFSPLPNPYFTLVQAPVIRAVREPGSFIYVLPAVFSVAWLGITPLIHRYFAFNGSYTQLETGKQIHATVIVAGAQYPIITVAQFKNTVLKLKSMNGSILNTVEEVYPTGQRPIYEAYGVQLRFLLF